MKIIDKIIKQENLLYLKTVEAKRNNENIYIYGCGILGKKIYHWLQSKSIDISGFCIDKQFCGNITEYDGKLIHCIDNLIVESNEKILVIIGMRNYKRDIHKENIKILDFDAFSVYDDNAFISYDYIEEKHDDFAYTANLLEDEKSKECMIAYLNQKISGDFKYLCNLHEENQYFDYEIVDFSKVSTYVDCGAYDGDSYFSFIKNHKANTKQKQNTRAYLLEPDPNNYKKLIEHCGTYENCNILNIGAWDHKDNLFFSTENTSSSINQNGNININVDKIDNVVTGSVDFIKMDIEGAELNALKGAKDTICRYHPVLAICVYHKKEDLITIPQYIQSICSEGGGYKFYLRIYSKYSQELVLYGIYSN